MKNHFKAFVSISLLFSLSIGILIFREWQRYQFEINKSLRQEIFHYEHSFIRQIFLSILRKLSAQFLLLFLLFNMSYSFVETSPENNAQNTRKKLVAAVLKDFPPLYSLDKEGRPEGFAIDLLKKISQKSGWQIEYKIVQNWDEAMDAVSKGQADFIPGIGISPSRQKNFLFSHSMETIPVSCFVRNTDYSSRYSDPESLKKDPSIFRNKKIGAIFRSAAHTKLLSYQGLNLKTYDTIEHALYQLLVGKIDVFIFPAPVLWNKAFDVGVEDRIKIVGKPFIELKRGYLFRRKDHNLVKEIDPILTNITKSRVYLKLQKKWYKSPEPFFNVQRVILFSLLIIVIITAFFLFWNFILKRQVEREIERRKKGELLLAQQSRMATMGELISIIAHQWKQPLNIISISSNLLPDLHKDVSGIEEMAKIIDDQVKFMSETLDDFRNFFHPVQKQREFNACDVISKVKTLIEPSLKKSEVELVISCVENCTVIGFPNDLMQVILNIITNARDAIIEKKVKQGKIECSLSSERNYLTIDISDNAGGIAEQLLPDKLFEPYITSKGEKGTGIGLQICKMLMEDRMNGSISARNNEKGAEFIIRMPLAKPKED